MLPTRELAVTVTYDLPKTKFTGAYKLDVSVYLDRKNKPSDKTCLSAVGDVNIVKNSVALRGETKFSYPTQSKVTWRNIDFYHIPRFNRQFS